MLRLLATSKNLFVQLIDGVDEEALVLQQFALIFRQQVRRHLLVENRAAIDYGQNIWIIGKVGLAHHVLHEGRPRQISRHLVVLLQNLRKRAIRHYRKCLQKQQIPVQPIHALRYHAPLVVYDVGVRPLHYFDTLIHARCTDHELVLRLSKEMGSFLQLRMEKFEEGYLCR